jgi:hypothetical protein
MGTYLFNIYFKFNEPCRIQTHNLYVPAVQGSAHAKPLWTVNTELHTKENKHFRLYIYISIVSHIIQHMPYLSLFSQLYTDFSRRHLH